MNDLNIQHVEHMTIATPAGRRFQLPNINITNQQFAAGLAHGLQAALFPDPLNKDRVLSDDDIIANMKIIFFEDETSTELAKQTDDEIAFACGQLVGELLARS